MNRDENQGKPFKALGDKLKAERQKKKRSIVEVSGAIEISEDKFRKIELGELRPAEDTLATLLSYLEIKDSDAGTFWDLAGYSDKNNNANPANIFELGQPITMMMPLDLRVVYTDMVHVMVNDFGVVMNFMQSAGNGVQPLAVSRIGMSKEHARSVLEILQKTLDQSAKAPKLLPESKENKSNKKPKE